jgi:exonuclease SbcC
LPSNRIIEHGKLKSALLKLEHTDQQNQALEAEYKVIGTLGEVLSGDNNAKVSLQRFVLGVLLDDVLLNATSRLRIMTRGRYDLIRKEDRSKGLKASGLELEVFDSYTGKSRHVATLSGGESFLAALALALGLSDVVQSYAGGIKLDTLFIDEGFGSLDPESLELAIDTLKNLQTAGRTIGIISHVQELKEQMPLRIDVSSSAQGSHIKVVGL